MLPLKNTSSHTSEHTHNTHSPVGSKHMDLAPPAHTETRRVCLKEMAGVGETLKRTLV